MTNFFEKQKKPPFGRLYRLLYNYEAVKKALSRNDVAEIIDRVPVFARSYFHDAEHSALGLMNPHDFTVVVRSAKIDRLEAAFTPLAEGVAVLSTLVPPPNQDDIHFQTYETFLEKPCVKLGSEYYNIRDLLFSVLYTSGVHALPGKESLRVLYANFVEDHPDEAAKLLSEIGGCLVAAVDFLHEANENEKLALIAMKNGPMLSDHGGKFTKNPDGNVLLTYQNADGHGSGMQMALKASEFGGIAITADIRLKDRNSTKNAFIFECGHRSDCDSKISLFQRGTKVIVQVGPSNDTKIIFDASLLTSPRSEFRLEVFPSCEINIFVKGQRIAQNRTARTFKVVDGKLALGADLYGRNSGAFTHSYLFIESISAHNMFDRVRTFDINQKHSTRLPMYLSPNDKRRLNHKYIGSTGSGPAFPL